MRRRKVLGIVGAVIATTAGCSEFGSDDDQDDSNGDNPSTGGSSDSLGDAETGPQQLVDDRRQVSEDDYYRWTFDVNQQATLDYTYTVRDGPEVDVFVLNDQEMDEFQAGNRFRAVSNDSGISGGGTTTLSSDSYRLVIDNTSAGDVAPPTNFNDDVVDVEIEATLEV